MDPEIVTHLDASSNNAASWQQHYLEDDFPWDKGEASPPLVEYLEQHPIRGKVLAPGCGRGHDVRALAAQGAEVLGVDLSTRAIELARSLNQDAGARFEQADLFQLPANHAASFDVVWEHTCFCAIHPEQRDDYVRAVHRALRPDGELLGIFFTLPEDDVEGPPFRTRLETVRTCFASHFEILEEIAPGQFYPSREGKETLLRMRRRRALHSQ